MQFSYVITAMQARLTDQQDAGIAFQIKIEDAEAFTPIN